MGGECYPCWRDDNYVNIVVGKPETYMLLGIRGFRWEDYIKMGLKMAVMCYLKSKLQMFNYLSEMIKRTLLNKSQQETTLQFYKVPAVLSLVYDMCWTPN
jgi:hypothetical protein